MKRILILALGVLMFAGAVQAQGVTVKGTLARERAMIDSIAAAVNAPTPVTISEHSIISGLDMYAAVAGSVTNLNMVGGGNPYRTFPVVGGVDVHGAKSLYLVLDWTRFTKGYFTITHKFSASANDTILNYYDGATWSMADSIVVNDSTGVGALTGLAATPGTLVFRIPDVPGAGYYFCKITARDKVHTAWITDLNATLVVVQ